MRSRPEIAWPFRAMPPWVGGTRPMMASARVDLPQPDSPTRPRHSPGFTSRLTPSTAFRVLVPPRSAPPTVKWTARLSSFSSGSTMMVAPHEAVRRQGGDVRRGRPADVGDGGAARIEAATLRVGRDRRHDARDLAQPLLAAPRTLAQAGQGIDEPLRIGMARRGEDRPGPLAFDDAAGIHHGAAPAHVGAQPEFMADPQEGRALAAAARAHQG